jgi:hypothetical protein
MIKNNKPTMEMLLKKFTNPYLEIAKKYGAIIEEYEPATQYIQIIQNDVDYFYVLNKIKNIIEYINQQREFKDNNLILLIDIIHNINETDKMTYKSLLYYVDLYNFELYNRLIRYIIDENENGDLAVTINQSITCIENYVEDITNILCITEPTQIKLTIYENELGVNLDQMQNMEEIESIKNSILQLVNLKDKLESDHLFTLLPFKDLINEVEPDSEFFDKMYKKYQFKRDLKKYLKEINEK